jgi:hypothetical protein
VGGHFLYTMAFHVLLYFKEIYQKVLSNASMSSKLQENHMSENVQESSIMCFKRTGRLLAWPASSLLAMNIQTSLNLS